MEAKEFDIVISKNLLARHIRDIYRDELKEEVPEYVKCRFDEIEVSTGTANQPTGRNIMECKEFDL